MVTESSESVAASIPPACERVKTHDVRRGRLGRARDALSPSIYDAGFADQHRVRTPPRPGASTRSMPVPPDRRLRRHPVSAPGFALIVLFALAGCSHGPSTYTPLTPPFAPGAESGAPSVEIDPRNGDALLAWVAGGPGEWRLWFARSHDRGATWSAPVLVTPPGEAIQLDLDTSPILVCDDERHV